MSNKYETRQTKGKPISYTEIRRVQERIPVLSKANLREQRSLENVAVLLNQLSMLNVEYL